MPCTMHAPTHAPPMHLPMYGPAWPSTKNRIDPPNLAVTALHDTAPVTIGGSVKKHLIFTKSENSKKFRGRVNGIYSALYHATTKWSLILDRSKLKIVRSRESLSAPNSIVCQAPNLTV